MIFIKIFKRNLNRITCFYKTHYCVYLLCTNNLFKFDNFQTFTINIKYVFYYEKNNI